MKLGIKDVCQINNFNPININKIFCTLCDALLFDNSKTCANSSCKFKLCNDCFNSNETITCSVCKQNKFVNYNPIELKNNNFLYYCSKSNNCKEKYSKEILLKNHTHNEKKSINFYCNYCKKDLNVDPNYLECFKCKKIYCHKNINYTPFPYKSLLKETKNNNDKKSPCIVMCHYCFNPICINCEKNINKYKNIICSNCKIKCDICQKNNAITICECCDNNLCESCIKKCKNCSMILCPEDFENLKKCDDHLNIHKKHLCKLCNTNKKSTKCNICNVDICSKTCMITCSSLDCEYKTICKNCTKFCNICKKTYCNKCSLYCNNCGPENYIVSCKNCKSDIFQKCSVKSCTNNLCLKCIQYCNYCEEICCKAHSLKCGNCKEIICRFHWHICRKCETPKVCLKNCTYKCFLCSNSETNALCKEENHPLDFCKNYNCKHKLCNSCIKKCDKCGKIVQTCTHCLIENVYSHCRFCDKNFCYECSNQCLKCGELFCCNKHKCFFCGTEIEKICPNCDFGERSKCKICSKGLCQCKQCFKKIICTQKCYLDNYIKYMESNEKKINYYYQSGNKRESNFKRSNTTHSNHNNRSSSYKSKLTSNLASNVFNTVRRLFTSNSNKSNNTLQNKNDIIKNSNENDENKSIIEDNEKHLCLMYWCNEHLGMEQMVKPEIKESGTVKDLLANDFCNVPKNNNTVDKSENKESINCSSCYIF